MSFFLSFWDLSACKSGICWEGERREFQKQGTSIKLKHPGHQDIRAWRQSGIMFIQISMAQEQNRSCCYLCSHWKSFIVTQFGVQSKPVNYYNIFIDSMKMYPRFSIVTKACWWNTKNILAHFESAFYKRDMKFMVHFSQHVPHSAFSPLPQSHRIKPSGSKQVLWTFSLW